MENETCLTCQCRAEKACFMCAHFDDERYCREACGMDKRRFETERHVCPECGKEWKDGLR